MKNYENYVLGSWIRDGDFIPLYNAINGDEIDLPIKRIRL